MPWCSAMLRVSAGTGLPAQEIWRNLIPIQGVAFCLGLIMIVLMGLIECRKGAGIGEKEFQKLKLSLSEGVELKVPRNVAFSTSV